VFSDPFCLTISDRVVQDEERFWTIGRLENLVILWLSMLTGTTTVKKSRGSSQPEKQLPGSEDSMNKLTSRQRQKELNGLAALPDRRINTSEIPELTDEQLGRAVRGQMYRPIKKPVTMRLDADVIAWLKEDGRGYQTKANALLRKEMIRSSRDKKAPGRAEETPGQRPQRRRR
jgi:uncharacterized protein (DUF4415 family)